MTGKFSDAPEVAAMATELIERFHPHLEGVRIDYLFRLGKWQSKGKQMLGQCRVISDLAAFLAGENEEIATAEGESFFVIAVWKPGWEKMNGDERRYIVDHELEHAKAEELFDAEGEPAGRRLYTAPHDIEEFGCIVERHGLVLPDRRAFAELCAAAMERQPGLDFEGDDTQVTLSVTTAEGERSAPVHTTGRGMRQAAEMSPGQMRAALKRAEERVA